MSPDALLNTTTEWLAAHPRLACALIIGWIAGWRIILGAPL